MGKKVSNKQQRAQGEFNIVVMCRNKQQMILSKIEMQAAELKSSINLLIEKGKLAHDDDEKKNIARQIKNLRDTLKRVSREEENVRSTVELFDRIIQALQTFMNREAYGFIIRKIPERKLPVLANDFSKREQLNKLLVSLLEKLDDDFKRRKVADNEMQKRIKTNEGMMDIFDERNQLDEPELNDIMKELETDTEVVIVAEKAEQNDTNRLTNKN